LNLRTQKRKFSRFILISFQKAASEAIEIIQIFVQYKGESLSHRPRNPIPSPQLTALWKETLNFLELRNSPFCHSQLDWESSRIW